MASERKISLSSIKAFSPSISPLLFIYLMQSAVGPFAISIGAQPAQKRATRQAREIFLFSEIPGICHSGCLTHIVFTTLICRQGLLIVNYVKIMLIFDATRYANR